MWVISWKALCISMNACRRSIYITLGLKKNGPMIPLENVSADIVSFFFSDALVTAQKQGNFSSRNSKILHISKAIYGSICFVAKQNRSHIDLACINLWSKSFQIALFYIWYEHWDVCILDGYNCMDIIVLRVDDLDSPDIWNTSNR